MDEAGEKALIRLSAPVNRFPDFVRYLVIQLKMLAPSMGKVRIAQVPEIGLFVGLWYLAVVLLIVRSVRKGRPGASAADRGP